VHGGVVVASVKRPGHSAHEHSNFLAMPFVRHSVFENLVADVRTMDEGATPYLHYAVSQRPDSGEEIVARTRGDASALLSAMRLALLALERAAIGVRSG
jgi:hypothetical protein